MSTAQVKVQMQIVEQLEQQINKEKRRLQGMVNHLQHFRRDTQEELIQEQPHEFEHLSTSPFYMLQSKIDNVQEEINMSEEKVIKHGVTEGKQKVSFSRRGSVRAGKCYQSTSFNS